MTTTTARTPTKYPHVTLDERGRAWIDDTSLKVVEVVIDRIGPDQMSPERTVAGRPQVSLAQVHAALAYYYDNQEDIDAELRRMDEEDERLRAAIETPEYLSRIAVLKAKWTGR